MTWARNLARPRMSIELHPCFLPRMSIESPPREADGTVPLGGILIMMSADIVLYGLLAYYLDNVLPTEYGTRRKPWFPFQLSFWVSET